MINISFCIVNLNARDVLFNCLKSIPGSIKDLTYEVIIVDNNSSDNSQLMVKTLFRDYQIIQNKKNEGYTKAINKGLVQAKGDYLVVLNPDTILQKESIAKLVNALKNNKNIGIIGPKVINEDGTFQKSCRRGLAKPQAVLSYFFGLSKLFPDNKIFTGYQLNHLDENKENEVYGVSGSCMVIKKIVINDIGYFDERYFAYQEDSDYCLRAINKGWKVLYFPGVQIIHKGGVGGSNSVPMKAIFEWHKSYYLYYKKHFQRNYSIFFNIFYKIIMLVKLIFSQILFLIKS